MFNFILFLFRKFMKFLLDGQRCVILLSWLFFQCQIRRCQMVASCFHYLIPIYDICFPKTYQLL